MTNAIFNQSKLPTGMAMVILILGTSMAQATTKDFTLKPGALIEAVYINAPGKKGDVSTKYIPALVEAIVSAGGEHLASFEVQKAETIDHPVTHVVMVQWKDVASREPVKRKSGWKKLEEKITSSGFFGVQQATPVSLDTSKVYDFTAAWTLAKSPEQMEVIMQIIGIYFGKIGPVIQKYGISTKSMFGPHPMAPKGESRYFPQMMGLFEWQKLSDIPAFEKDPDFTAHVDIRNATFARKEDKIFGTLLPH